MDYQKSLKEAKEQNKALLLFFTGSDWSGPCMQMKKESLDSSHFQKQIQQAFICVEVDFPKHTILDEALQRQNLELKESFYITDFPCLVLLNQEEQEIGRFFSAASHEKLAGELVHLAATDASLQQGLQSLEVLDAEGLISLFYMAEQLDNQKARDALIQQGCASDEASFFLVEAYRSFVQQGATQQAEQIRGQLEEAAAGEQKIAYSLALIDFQDLAGKSGQEANPDCIVEPLKNYLHFFGEVDLENSWRVEMMIAQVYLSADACEKAHEFAKRAYERAPVAFKGEISHSLDYISSHSIR